MVLYHFCRLFRCQKVHFPSCGQVFIQIPSPAGQKFASFSRKWNCPWPQPFHTDMNEPTLTTQSLPGRAAAEPSRRGRLTPAVFIWLEAKHGWNIAVPPEKGAHSASPSLTPCSRSHCTHPRVWFPSLRLWTLSWPRPHLWLHWQNHSIVLERTQH